MMEGPEVLVKPLTKMESPKQVTFADTDCLDTCIKAKLEHDENGKPGNETMYQGACYK